MSRIGAGLVLLGLALLTHRQVQIWASPETLWTQAMWSTPGAARPHVNLGVLAIRRGDEETGERLLLQASELAARRRPRDRRVAVDIIMANLASLRIRQGRWQEARWWASGAPSGSTRWLVCQRVPTLCA